MLTSYESEKIYVDVLGGRPLSLKAKNPEHKKEMQEYYDLLKKDIDAAKKRGVTKFHIPWDGD